jgi:2,4-diaminopentanoate dehydrogenase
VTGPGPGAIGPRLATRPRIAIYGAGHFGQYIARLADAKGWPVVAAYNRAGPKVGQDIGRLAGLDHDLGVIVEDCDRADYGRLQADVAVVTVSSRLDINLPGYRRLLGAGVNVVSIGGESQYPWAVDPAVADELDQLARAHGVTFTGTGMWDISRTWAALLITGNCTELRGLYHRSVTNSEAQRPETITQMGVGMSRDEFEDKVVNTPGKLGNLFPTVPHHVLSAMGYTVTGFREWREPVISDRPFHCRTLNLDLPVGSIMGTRVVIETDTAEGVRATMHVEVRLLFREGETEHMMWEVDGLPSSTITIERRDSRHATASAAFNRIPDAIAGPPGIQPASALGPMRHSSLL